MEGPRLGAGGWGGTTGGEGCLVHRTLLGTLSDPLWPVSKATSCLCVSAEGGPVPLVDVSTELRSAWGQQGVWSCAPGFRLCVSPTCLGETSEGAGWQSVREPGWCVRTALLRWGVWRCLGARLPQLRVGRKVGCGVACQG